MILKKTASTEAEGIHCANKYTNKDLFGIQIKVKELAHLRSACIFRDCAFLGTLDPKLGKVSESSK